MCSRGNVTPSGPRRLVMGNINMGRVAFGGLIAGLVIAIGEILLNTLILGRMWNEAMKAINRPALDAEPPTFFILLSLALGLITVYIYAAIRPRYGAGVLTAVCAGLIVWALASLYSSAAMLPLHLFPRRLLLYACVWEFFELPLASIAGCWLYKEDSISGSDQSKP